jgi:capsular exopolysaccharide synthesis family protein
MNESAVTRGIRAVDNAVTQVEQIPRWWWPLRANARHLLLSGLPIALLIAIYGFLAQPVFESRALLEVRSAVSTGNAPLESIAQSLPILMNTQKEIIGSALVAGDFQDNLLVEVVPDSYLLTVRYRASDPLQAQTGASVVAQAYVNFSANAQLDDVKRAARLLISAIENVNQEAAFVDSDLASSGSDVGFNVLGRPPIDDLLPELYPGEREGGLLQDTVSGMNPVLESVLLEQLVETYDQTLNQLVSARIIDPAPLPDTPVDSMPSWWILLGYFGTVAVPAFVLAMRFRWRDTLDFAQDVQDTLALDCMTKLPALDLTSYEDFSSNQAYVSALALLRTRLKIRHHDPDPLAQFARANIILLSSSVKGEGKSSVAYNLALSMGASERVLLIDADMRSLRDFAGVKAGAPGLSHLLAGAAQLRDCVHRNQALGIDIIPAGVLPPNPEHLLSSLRFKRVLDVLERRFDSIIIDAPALSEVSDTLILASRCRVILLVVAAGETKADTVKASAQQLLGADMPELAVVLNRARSLSMSAAPWR